MATIREVAEHAGVSIATVSFVINKTKPVTPATTARIEAAMSALGYRPNAAARALASRRTRMLALAYPALDHRLGGSGMEFMVAAAREANTHGYHLMMWPGAGNEQQLRDLVGRRLVDAVIVMEVQLEDARVQVLQETSTPYALIGRTSSPGDSPHVDIDFDQTVNEAIGHLHALGHRDIVFVTGTENAESYRTYGPYVRTEQAFRAAAERLGVETRIVRASPSSRAGREVAKRLLVMDWRPTAAMVLNEFTAVGLVNGLVHAGVSVPGEVSVLPLLASEETSGFTEPTLTIMRTPGAELGALAVDHLVRLMAGETPEPILLPSTLVPGGSTAAASA